ncbi:10083_t:CDS:2, partial [Racocetra persica]
KETAYKPVDYYQQRPTFHRGLFWIGMSQSPDQVSRSTQTDSRPTTEQATQYNQEDIKPGNSGAGISNFPYPNQVFEKYFSLLREKIEKDDLSRRAEYDRTEKEQNRSSIDKRSYDDLIKDLKRQVQHYQGLYQKRVEKDLDKKEWGTQTDLSDRQVSNLI